jgi:hypothetical protein
MKLVGLRKDKDTDEIIEYELNVNTHNVTCLYKDKYGCYICLSNGRMLKVKHDLKTLREVFEL